MWGYLEDLSLLLVDLAEAFDSAAGFDSVLDFDSVVGFVSAAALAAVSVPPALVSVWESPDLVSVDAGFSPLSALASDLYASLR